MQPQKADSPLNQSRSSPAKLLPSGADPRRAMLHTAPTCAAGIGVNAAGPGAGPPEGVGGRTRAALSAGKRTAACGHANGSAGEEDKAADSTTSADAATEKKTDAASPPGRFPPSIQVLACEVVVPLRCRPAPRVGGVTPLAQAPASSG